MKVCTKCQVEKNREDFPANRRKKDGKASWCRDCFSNSYKKRYYNSHSHYLEKHKESRNRLRDEKARLVYDYLRTHPCIDCGESDPVVLEFDHKAGEVKVESVCILVAHNFSWNKIETEIKKCEVRCANCHRRKTANHFGYKRFVFNEDTSTSSQLIIAEA
jgi:hypothetical protein